MVLLKSTVVVLLAVACVSAVNLTVANSTSVKSLLDHDEQKTEVSVHFEPTVPSPSGSNVTDSPPTSSSTTTTTAPPTTTTTTPLPVTTTTAKPSSTTSPPDVTTTIKPSSTTHSPNGTTTTLSPNGTTTIPPTPEPSPAPSPARSWDGPSFLGGMVLAFGIVAVGFVGYRFFYLGRGGAYHTL